MTKFQAGGKRKYVLRTHVTAMHIDQLMRVL